MASLRRLVNRMGRPFGYALFRSEADRAIQLLGDPIQENFTHLDRAIRDLQAEVERLGRLVESLQAERGR